MFSLAGLRDEKVFWGILATGVINLIATLIALKLIEVLGRRPLIIWPLAAIVIIMVSLTILIVLNVRVTDEVFLIDERLMWLLVGEECRRQERRVGDS